MNKTYIKGFLEDIVVHLIREKGESYGYELTRMVEERTKGVITINEGALYPVLHKLEQKGILVGEFKTTANRPRKYYRLAIQHQKAVDKNQTDAKAYIAALQSIFNFKSFENGNG
ncbi:MAG: helix-turn-helix transcriptional regulator [Cryomorphaceae bacterium]|nr:helix-turn-helix transcriptional regulator [Cryomorphaceae bacterium]